MDLIDCLWLQGQPHYPTPAQLAELNEASEMQSEQLTLAEKSVQEIIVERDRITAAIAAYTFVLKVWPSNANFFLIRVLDADAVMERCREHKVLLRHFGGELADCIRITVGSATDNNRLLDALNSLAEG